MRTIAKQSRPERTTERTTEQGLRSEAGRTPASIAAELIEPLGTMIERYESFVKSLESHRAAISQADGRGIDAAIARESELLDELIALDDACRRTLGQHTVNGIATQTGEGWTLTRLAAAIGGDEGQRIAESSAYLKALTSRADILQKSIREASHAMAAHIDGLVRQVSQRLSHAGTYGAAGRVEAKAPVVSGLDMSL